MQKFFDNIIKIIFALAAVVFLLAITSMYFGYVLLAGFIAALIAAVALLIRARARDRERMRELRPDLDRARRWS